MPVPRKLILAGFLLASLPFRSIQAAFPTPTSSPSPVFSPSPTFSNTISSTPPADTPTATLTQTAGPSPATPTLTPSTTSTPAPPGPSLTHTPGLVPSPPVGAGRSYVYPDPVRGSRAHCTYNAAFTADAEIVVFRADGSQVASAGQTTAAGPQILDLDVSSFANGVYYYLLTLNYVTGDSEQLAPQKFLVLR